MKQEHKNRFEHKHQFEHEHEDSTRYDQNRNPELTQNSTPSGAIHRERIKTKMKYPNTNQNLHL